MIRARDSRNPLLGIYVVQEEEKNHPEANYLDGSFPDTPAAFVACKYPIIGDIFGMNVTTPNQPTTRPNPATGKCGETRNEGIRPRAHWHSPISRDEDQEQIDTLSVFFLPPTPSHFCTVRCPGSCFTL